MKLKALLVLNLILSTTASNADQLIERSKGEACMLADQVPIEGVEYSKKDTKNQNELCEYDFNESTASDGVVPVALCPKLFSTNPAIELIEIPEGSDKKDYEGNECNKTVGGKNDGKKVAKYKQSMSCSKTPSIIGYYHISRALGIDSTPVSVLRTMKKETHLSVATNGYNYSKKNPGELVSKNWAKLVSLLKSNSSDIMTDDKEFSIGALSENPRGEQKYYEDFYPNAGGLDGVKNFKSVNVYKNIGINKHVSQFIGTDLTSANYTAIQKMKDAVDLIILDTIFGQQDRFGNVHAYHSFLVQEGGENKKYSMKDLEDALKKEGTAAEQKEIKAIKDLPNSWKPEITARNKRIVALASAYFKRKGLKFAHAQEMFLKDNDCGLKVSNVFISQKMVDGVKHINRKTYLQLVKLHSKVASGQMDEYLANTLYMDKTEMDEFKTGLNYVANNLIKKCQAKELFLDLNVKAHFAGTNTGADECSTGSAPAPAPAAGIKVVNRAGVNIRTTALESESTPTDASKLIIGGVAQMAMIGDQVEVQGKLVVGTTTFLKVKIVKAANVPAGSIVYIWEQAF